MGIIYLIRHKESGKCYVGQTVGTLKARLNKHRNSSGCPYIHNAIKHYGQEAFEVKELGCATDRDVLNLLEREFIAQYCSAYPEGYNLRTTGDGSYHHSASKAKISAKAKEQFADAETRNKAATSRGSKPFTVYCKHSGNVLWSGVNKQECFRHLKLLPSALRHMLSSPTRSSKGCVAKYDCDPRPILLDSDLTYYRQQISLAAGNGLHCPAWQDLFVRIA
jgi:group I intron endonuclease